MFGYIYRTTNLINGKMYIGQHRAATFECTSYIGSGILLTAAINKYGKQNFKCEPLDSINGVPTVCDTAEELDASEIYYIKYYNCVEDSAYYNIAIGGSGGNHGDTVNQLISEHTRGKNTWTKGRVTINNGLQEKKIYPKDLSHYLNSGWQRGKLKTEKVLQGFLKCSETHRNKTAAEKAFIIAKQVKACRDAWSAKTEEEISLWKEHISKSLTHEERSEFAWNKGKPLYEWATPEHIDKLKQAWHKPKTEEHKKKISEVRKLKGLAKGEKNPMYGKGYKVAGDLSANAKKVMCIETGKIYLSTISAGEDTGIKPGRIQDTARGVQKTAGGFHWVYLDKEIT